MRTRRYGGVFAMCLAAGVWAGCAGMPKASAPVDPGTLDDMAFVHEYLASQATVSTDEAYRAMLILADGHDASKTFDERRARLEQEGIARAAWNLRADQCIDKGSVAYMVCRILKIRGGVNSLVFGSWGPGDRRYALRELVYRKMMADAPAYRYIAGAELAALLRKADEYMQKRGMYAAESVEIGPDPASTRPAGSGR